ncbi:MAG: glycosyltransferase family 4 protein [Thaumarchaeota archaeon]|nr:glycosyltransferase family 4 protein [Nitrososphaerota archaeon]
MINQRERTNISNNLKNDQTGIQLEESIIALVPGGSRESVENGVTGFYVNPFDVKDIAEKISNLLTNFDLCKTMGINGRKKLRENLIFLKHIAL